MNIFICPTEMNRCGLRNEMDPPSPLMEPARPVDILHVEEKAFVEPTNFFLGVNSAPVPTRFFTNGEEAVRWLTSQGHDGA